MLRLLGKRRTEACKRSCMILSRCPRKICALSDSVLVDDDINLTKELYPMQFDITPSLITALSAFAVALERNPTGGMLMLTMLAMVAISHRPK